MSIPSRRPYLIRAIYEWAVDNNLTPYLVVAAEQPGVVVPPGYARDGRITLDISPMAVRSLDLRQDPIHFSARFGGRSYDIWVPSGAVVAVFARENGEGMLFGEPEAATADAASAAPVAGGSGNEPPDAPRPNPTGRPRLRVVK
jgi:stringent starvation protein B